jgi:hypothetical protein
MRKEATTKQQSSLSRFDTGTPFAQDISLNQDLFD